MHRENGIEELISILDRAGIAHSLHKVIPFIGEIEPDINPAGPVMVIGSYSLRHVARKKGWVPGVFDLGSLTYSEHLDHWGDHMLNADAIFCPFSEVLERLPEGLNEFFIRPVVDSKFFTGTVMDVEEFATWRDKVITLHDADEMGVRATTEVMVCRPKNIQREYRLWIVDGEVATASLYKMGGRVLYDGQVENDIIAFGRERAREWSPNRAYVLDLALMPDGSTKIVETNTLNAAGLYAANVGKLVDAIMRMEFH